LASKVAVKWIKLTCLWVEAQGTREFTTDELAAEVFNGRRRMAGEAVSYLRQVGWVSRRMVATNNMSGRQSIYTPTIPEDLSNPPWEVEYKTQYRQATKRERAFTQVAVGDELTSWLYGGGAAACTQ